MYPRLRAGLFGLTAAASLALGASVCTTFSGLEASGPDASVVLEASPGDAAPDAGQATYLSFEDAARACSLIFECPNLAGSIVYSMAVPVDELNYSLCLHWLAGPVPPSRVGFGVQSETFECLAAATTCEQAGACLWVEYFAADDPRCADAGSDAGADADAGAATDLSKCSDDGKTLLRCEYNYAIHCDSPYYAPGTACLQGSDGSLGCALGINCSGMTACVGSILTYCAMDNLKYSLNCAYGGYACGINEQSGYPCIPPDTAIQCNIPGATRCADDIVWVCDGLYESGFDCKDMGGLCSDTEGSARCVPRTPACSPSDPNVNICAGTKIDVCVGGNRTTFDCASIGMACLPGAQGKSPHCG